MGRSQPAMTRIVDDQLHELEKLYKALRVEDKDAFNTLVSSVKKHVSALSYANPVDPSTLMLWLVVFELQKKVEKMRLVEE